MSILIDDLRSSFVQAGSIIDQVGDQRDNPTPCEAWNVQQVIDHLLVGLTAYCTAFDADQTPIEGDSSTRFQTLGQRFIDAAASRDDDAGPVRVPFGVVPAPMAIQLGVVELLVHGWDIATATGQPFEADDAVAERALAFSRATVQQIPPERSPFQAPVEVDESASPLEQLVALLGRRP